jgi:hypothetical protein
VAFPRKIHRLNVVPFLQVWTNREMKQTKKALASANRSVDLEREPGGARSVISTYCGVAIDPNMSMCGDVRSCASDCGDAAKKVTECRRSMRFSNIVSINHLSET